MHWFWRKYEKRNLFQVYDERKTRTDMVLKRQILLFKIANTTVKISPSVFINILFLWAFLSWLTGIRHPERLIWERILTGVLASLLLLIADLGHTLAHIFSARYAGAPMDEIHIPSGMPRTIYHDNHVHPSVHRLRSFGGPIFNLLGLVISLVWHTLTLPGSMANDLATWSVIGFTFILVGSLTPLPYVDGGTMLKWTLVEHGRTLSQADAIVRRVDLILGALLITLGLVLLFWHFWWWGLLILAGAAIVIASGLGILR